MSLEARIKFGRWLASLFCCAVILVSAFTLLGWFVGVDWLVNPFQMGITIRVNTAICMLLSASAILLMNSKYNFPARHMIIWLISCFVSIIAILTLAQYVYSIDLHIDELLVKDKFTTDVTMYPGRMVMLTAMVFLLQSIAIYLLNSKMIEWKKYANIFIYVAFAMTMIGLYQYLFSYDETYQITLSKNFLEYMCNMSLTCSIMFMMTLTSLLLITPLQNCMEYIIDRSIVGYLTRILVLGSFIIFPLIAITLKFGQDAHLYDYSFAYTLGNSVAILCVTMLTFHVVKYLRDAINDKNNTLNKLRDRELLFRNFAEHIDSVFWQATPDMKQFTYVSPAYDIIFKRSRNELLANANCILDHIIDEDRSKYQNDLLKVLNENGDFVEAEYRIVDNNGIVKHLCERAFKLRDSNQNVSSIIGVISDMTAIRFTEKYAHIQKRINTILNSGLGIHEIANEFVRIICESQGWEIGELWLKDEHENALKCVELWYAPGLKLSKFEKIGKSIALQMGVGLQGKTWQEGRPIWSAILVVVMYCYVQMKPVKLAYALLLPFLSSIKISFMVS